MTADVVTAALLRAALVVAAPGVGNAGSSTFVRRLRLGTIGVVRGLVVTGWASKLVKQHITRPRKIGIVFTRNLG